MSYAHIHLLLNHIPILGTIFGLLLLIYAMIRRSVEVTRASLGAFVITALLTIPVYATGDGAADIIRHLPDASTAIIRQHDDAATYALASIEILGALSLLILWLIRGANEAKRWMIFSALVLAGLASGFGIWTGKLGGQIRHSEVRPGFVETK